MKQYLLAFDQGTSSSRAILFDRRGHIVASAQQEFPQHYPASGWVEQDAQDIWQSQLAVAKATFDIGRVTASDIAAIGITNQRETTILWDANTGKPVAPAIVWMCRRTADICSQWEEAGLGPLVREKTGLPLDAYFSASKIVWLLENIPGLRQRADKGEIRFGTVDSWLLYCLTEGKVHATDYTNASRTLLFDIHRGCWDDELLRIFHIPESLLPQVLPSAGFFGETTLFGSSIPITGMAGDQQAALFGQGCFDSGMAKNTYGTGCFLLMHTGKIPVTSHNGLLTTIATHIAGTTTYALEGSVFQAGSAVQWLRDNLGLIANAGDTQAAALAVPDNGGVYFVPAFSGLGAPYWDMFARGILCGLTRASNKNHIIRAVLESIAYQVADVLQAMEEDAGLTLKTLQVDGGAAANDFLIQFQADILDTPVLRPSVLEVTAFGAAALAGLSIGYYQNQQELQELHKEFSRFQPAMAEKKRQQLLHNWHKAVARAKNWQEK